MNIKGKRQEKRRLKLLEQVNKSTELFLKYPENKSVHSNYKRLVREYETMYGKILKAPKAPNEEPAKVDNKTIQSPPIKEEVKTEIPELEKEIKDEEAMIEKVKEEIKEEELKAVATEEEVKELEEKIEKEERVVEKKKAATKKKKRTTTKKKPKKESK